MDEYLITWVIGCVSISTLIGNLLVAANEILPIRFPSSKQACKCDLASHELDTDVDFFWQPKTQLFIDTQRNAFCAATILSLKLMCEFSVAKTTTAVLPSASQSSLSKISCVRPVSPHPGGNQLYIVRATAHMWDMLSVCWVVFGDTVCCYRAQEFYVAPTVRRANLICSLKSCCKVLVLGGEPKRFLTEFPTSTLPFYQP